MTIFPQQRKLTGSSAIFGVHRCRRWVGFNRVQEKVPEKVPEKVWEALVQSQVRFNRASRRFRRRFRRRFEEALDAKPSQVQRVARKVAEAKPGQGHLTPGILAEVFPALGFAARFRKICKK